MYNGKNARSRMEAGESPTYLDILCRLAIQNHLKASITEKGENKLNT